jgi:hypothetical protein
MVRVHGPDVNIQRSVSITSMDDLGILIHHQTWASYSPGLVPLVTSLRG